LKVRTLTGNVGDLENIAVSLESTAAAITRIGIIAIASANGVSDPVVTAVQQISPALQSRLDSTSQAFKSAAQTIRRLEHKLSDLDTDATIARQIAVDNQDPTKVCREYPNGLTPEDYTSRAQTARLNASIEIMQIVNTLPGPMTPVESGADTPGLTGSDVGHLALDGAGLVPGLGAFADITNALWYGVEGNMSDAGLSLVGLIPLLGDAASAGRLSKNGYKIGKDALKIGAEGAEVASDAAHYSKLLGKLALGSTALFDDSRLGVAGSQLKKLMPSASIQTMLPTPEVRKLILGGEDSAFSFSPSVRGYKIEDWVAILWSSTHNLKGTFVPLKLNNKAIDYATYLDDGNKTITQVKSIDTTAKTYQSYENLTNRLVDMGESIRPSRPNELMKTFPVNPQAGLGLDGYAGLIRENQVSVRELVIALPDAKLTDLQLKAFSDANRRLLLEGIQIHYIEIPL